MNILRLPNPLLREKSKKVESMNAEIKSLCAKLKEQVYINKGCVGIAAPQTGSLRRIVVVDASAGRKKCENHGLIEMINPVIIRAEGSSINREGCLSVPEYTGNVERADSVAIKYLDLKGEERLLEASGFEAVIFQHEIDHLEGILFPDRVVSNRDLFLRKTF